MTHAISQFFSMFMYLFLFNDNYATGSSLTSATLSCHVELSKCNNAGKTLKTKPKYKNEYTLSLTSNTAFPKLLNSN